MARAGAARYPAVRLLSCSNASTLTTKSLATRGDLLLERGKLREAARVSSRQGFTHGWKTFTTSIAGVACTWRVQARAGNFCLNARKLEGGPGGRMSRRCGCEDIGAGRQRCSCYKLARLPMWVLDRSFHHSTIPSFHHSISQSVNQSSSQSVNQSIN